MDIVRVGAGESLAGALDRAGAPTGRPVLVVVGGAAGVGAGDSAAIAALFRDVVVPVVVACGAALVDGGTDSGVMQALGDALEAAGSPVPLVGVTVAALAEAPDPGAHPGGRPQGAPLGRHHTHVLLVDGSRWGDESEALAEVAGLLAGTAPTATLLVNGGAVSRSDVALSLRLERPVVAVRGSGRLADELADEQPDGVVVLEPHWPLADRRQCLAELLGAAQPSEGTGFRCTS